MLVCRGPLIPISGRHSRITLGGLSTTRILSFSTRCAFIIKAWGANLHVVHWVDFVFINATTPAKDNWHVGGLRELDLSEESFHDPQRLSQRTGVEQRSYAP